MKNQEQVLKEQEQIKKISEKFEAMYEAGELMVPGKALCMNSAPESANAENALARVALSGSASEASVATMATSADDYYYVTGNCNNVYLYTYTYEGIYALSYVGRLYYNSSGSNSSNYCFQVYANYDSLISSYGADNLNGVNLFLGTTSYSGSEPYYIYDYTSGEYLGYTVANSGMIGFYLKAIYEYTGQINFLVYHQPATPQVENFYASEGYVAYLYNCLSSLTIQSMPTKTAYVEGESFDTSGLVVRADYLDGSYFMIPLSACTVSVSGFNNTDINLSIGTRQSQTVTVNIAYDQLTVAQTMSITMAPKFELNLTKMPNELHYVEGQKFDATGMAVQALYHDGTTKEVTGYTCTPDTALEDGDRLITVTYTEDGLTKTETLWVDVATAEEGYYGNRNISASNYGENPIWNLQTMGLRYLQNGLSIGMNGYIIGANLVYDSQMKDKLKAKCKGMPDGWKLDAHQFIVLDGKDDRGYPTYKYLDGEGYVHAFEKYSEYSNEYYDTEGAGLVLTVGTTYSIKDKNNNKMCFDAIGRLIKIVSGRNTANIKHYQYDSNGRLTKIYDNRKTARYVSFEYDTNNLLAAMKTYENNVLFQMLALTYSGNNIVGITKNGVSISAFTYDENGKLQLIADKQTNNAVFVTHSFGLIRNDYEISKISRGIVDADNDFMEKTFEKWTTTNTQNDFKTYCEICIENEKGVRIAHKMDSDGNMVSSMEKISNYDYKTLEKDVGVKLLYSSGAASYKVNGENAFSLYNSAYIPNEVMLNVEGTTEALKDYRCYNLNFWLNYYSEDFEKLYACITYTSNGMEYKVYSPIDAKLIRVWQKITLPIDLQDANGSFSNIKLSFVTFNESNTAIKQYISGYVSCFRMVPNAISKLNIMGQSFEDTISISTASGTVQLKSENHKFTRSDFMKTMESFNLKKLGREEAWQIYYDNGKKRVEGSHFFGMTYDKFSANFMENTDPEWYVENISADGRVITKQYYEYNEKGCLTTTKTTIDGGEEIVSTTQGTYQKPDCQIEDSGHGVKIKREYFDDGNLKKETLVAKDENAADTEMVIYQATRDSTGEYITQEKHGYFVNQTYTYSNFMLDKMERIGYNNNKYKETYEYDALQENLEELTAYENGIQKAWNVMTYENGELATIWDRKADYKFDRYQDLDQVIFNIRDNSHWIALETQWLNRETNEIEHSYFREKDEFTDTLIYAYDEYGKPISETYNDETKVTYNYTSGSESEAAWPLATIVDGYCGRTYTYTYNVDGSAKSVSFDGFSVEKVNESEKKYTIGTDTITQKVVQDTKPRAITHTFNGTETPIFDRYYTYDNFGRMQKKQSLKKNEDETYTLLSEAEVGHGHLYMEPVSDTYKRGEETKYSAEYRHDQWGNVETVTHSGLFDGTVTYEYDALSRLKKETTAGSTVLPNGVKTYEYEDTYGRMSTFNGNALEFDKRGRLKTCGALEFTYDNYGNCTKKQNYNTGEIFNYTWTRGRLLASVNGTTYTYDKNGVRTRKVVVDGDNTITHEYFYDGNKLIAEKVGDKYFYFFYDESGVCGFRYENINYEYVKNIFGDVIGIYNEYGTHVATYAYDAWGNMTCCNAGTAVAMINPFLYRGCYYDSESGLYYLMSRYYDPKIGRFISPDTPDYLKPDTVGGVDLYAYGLNNPVMYVDPTGHIAFFVLTMLIGAAIGFGITTAVDYLDDGEVFNGSVHWGWYLGATLVGAAIGAGIGMAVSYSATGSIASSTGQVFKGLFKSTSLYRTVSPDEFLDIKNTGRFNQGPNSMEGKFFAKTRNGAKTWGKGWGQSHYVKIKIPRSSLNHSSVTPFNALDAIDDAYYFSDLEYLNSMIGKIWFF